MTGISAQVVTVETRSWGTVNALIGYGRDAEDKFARLKHGSRLVIKSLGSRNVKHHNKAWAIVREALKHQERFQSAEALMEAALIEAGHSELREKLSGERYYVSKSIAFAKLSQADFEPVYEGLLAVLSDFIGVEPSQLENEAMRIEGIAA